MKISLIIFSLVLSLVFGQNVYNIAVGNGSQLFNPPFISRANPGDILSFKFWNSSYNVYQTLGLTCTRLPLGFKSDSYPGTEAANSTYNYTISEVLQGQTIYVASSNNCTGNVNDFFQCQVDNQFTLPHVSVSSSSVFKLSFILVVLLICVPLIFI